MFGQDTGALLISVRNILAGQVKSFAVFGLPKSTIYAGSQVNFSTFGVPSLTAPVTNAGQPMLSSASSFFLAAVPGTGYRLFRLSNGGGSGATLTLQATISASFTAPGRASQPGTGATLNASDGNILASPYFDGTAIWFTHVVDFFGHPTITYGAVDVTTNTVTRALAMHSSTSDDFNPSLAVGLTPAGPVVYLNWVFTDAPNGLGASPIVDSLPAGQPVTNLAGTGTVLASGGSSTEDRFGDFSSVAIDPSIPSGGCAWSVQQYFSAAGDWTTRLARLGPCRPPVTVPDLIGDTRTVAATTLSAAGLPLGAVGSTVDYTCANINRVMRQSIPAGSRVAPGTAVGITIGAAPPPRYQCQ